jgi:hypothetical protein
MSLQPSFLLPCVGSGPAPDTSFHSNFDSFVLTLMNLTERNDLAASFYLRINVIFLSWGFSCFSGRKELAGTECKLVKYSNKVRRERLREGILLW